MNLIQSVNKLDYLKFGEKETWWQKSCEKKKQLNQSGDKINDINRSPLMRICSEFHMLNVKCVEFAYWASFVLSQ